ncbi:hypothetical protein BDZ97DRAFT_1668023 [Flammula alnicola]|nr:hypothetical protein BDZ97DRAFT_1668023 [Flammula alnicola]
MFWQDFPMRQWLLDREVFLAEFLRLESRGTLTPTCRDCGDTGAQVYRCIDCDGRELYCSGCLLRRHFQNGLHRIEVWREEGYFAKTSFKSLGFCFQLGHPLGESCHFPVRSSHNTFTVIETNGIHEVTLNYCGCGTPPPHFVQLLRFGWYPSTVGFPRSAATLRVLNTFQILSFESKASAFEYYQSLARLSDNIGTTTIPDRYRAFMRMVRQYRNIKMLKRSGRGHESSGAAGTRQRECAVLCPACPHPGVNLESDWRDAPPEKRFLYTLFLGMDANFRLKRKMVSNNASDPSLSNGWAYFVHESEFKEFLNTFGTLVIQEPSTCSNHNAVNKERGKDGLAASGAGTVDCTRHDMKRPSSVGDLQKGERYVNMDYLFCSSVELEELVEVVISYDIACQWSINLWERLKIYPSWMRVNHDSSTSYRFLVPKFHLPAHVLKCQTKYSFNFNPKVGRTDGEGVERGWAHINPIASSTREMGPGARRDTLDDHFGDWNWKKTVKLATILLKRITDAVPEMVEHRELHKALTERLPAEDVSLWEVELSAWEKDTSLPNPMETRVKALSQNAVRLQLADEEHADASLGVAYVMHEEISASHLISMGIDLEESQRQTAMTAASLSSTTATDKQKTNLKLRMSTLKRKIEAWIEVQHMYIPSLRMVRARAHDAMDEQLEIPAHEVLLRLPSSLTSTTPCDMRLLSIEWKLRQAQASDALDDLREGLRLRSYVLIDKARFQHGQVANTRANTIVVRCQAKVNAAANRYCAARSALAGLAPRLGVEGWENLVPELKKGDIRAAAAEDDDSEKARKKQRRKPGGTEKEVASEGHRMLSWIWRHAGVGEQMHGDGALHDILRVEWCKSRARQDRWREEVELLQEEMRHVQQFLLHRAATWSKRAADLASWCLPNVPADPLFDAGRVAFALNQQEQFLMMARHCGMLWCNVAKYVQSEGRCDIVPRSSSMREEDDGEDDEVSPLQDEAEHNAPLGSISVDAL